MSFSGSSTGNGAGWPTRRRALRRDLPHVEREGHEVVARERHLVGQTLDSAGPRSSGTVEPTLARDDDALGEIAQHRVRRTAIRAPRTRTARALALLPDHLAAEEQPEAILQDRDDVGRQAPIRLAAEVGDVHRDPSTRLERADAVREHGGEELEVLEVRARHPFLLELLLVVLAREVRRRRDDERNRTVVDGVHRASVATDERIGDRLRRRDLVGVGEVGGLESTVEGGRVVALAPPDSEVRRGRAATLPHPTSLSRR